MKKFNVYFLAALMAMSAAIIGCDREKEAQFETTTVEDHQQAEEAFADIELIVQESMQAGGGREEDASGGRTESCATRTVDMAARRMVVDFGVNGCTGPDGRLRKGKIIHTYSGSRPRTAGHVVTTTFDNYSVNGNKIEGTHVDTYNGLNAQGDPNSTVTLTGGKVTFTDGTTATRNSQHTRTWKNAGGAMADDEFVIAGTASGKTRRDVNYTASITTPLVRKAACFASNNYYPVSGKIEVTPQGQLTRTVDYGNGTCDNSITITVGNRTVTVILP